MSQIKHTKIPLVIPAPKLNSSVTSFCSRQTNLSYWSEIPTTYDSDNSLLQPYQSLNFNKNQFYDVFDASQDSNLSSSSSNYQFFQSLSSYIADKTTIRYDRILCDIFTKNNRLLQQLPVNIQEHVRAYIDSRTSSQILRMFKWLMNEKIDSQDIQIENHDDESSNKIALNNFSNPLNGLRENQISMQRDFSSSRQLQEVENQCPPLVALKDETLVDGSRLDIYRYQNDYLQDGSVVFFVYQKYDDNNNQLNLYIYNKNSLQLMRTNPVSTSVSNASKNFPYMFVNSQNVIIIGYLKTPNFHIQVFNKSLSQLGTYQGTGIDPDFVKVVQRSGSSRGEFFVFNYESGEHFNYQSFRQGSTTPVINQDSPKLPSTATGIDVIQRNKGDTNFIVSFIQDGNGKIEDSTQDFTVVYTKTVNLAKEIRVASLSDKSGYIVAYIQSSSVYMLTVDSELKENLSAFKVGNLESGEPSMVRIKVLKDSRIIISYVIDKTQLFFDVYDTKSLKAEGPSHGVKSSNPGVQNILQHNIEEFQNGNIFLFQNVEKAGLLYYKIDGLISFPGALTQSNSQSIYRNNSFKISEDLKINLQPFAQPLSLLYTIKVTDSKKQILKDPQITFQNFGQSKLSEQGVLTLPSSFDQVKEILATIQINPNGYSKPIIVQHSAQVCSHSVSLVTQFNFTLGEKSNALVYTIIGLIGGFIAVGLVVYVLQKQFGKKKQTEGLANPRSDGEELDEKIQSSEDYRFAKKKKSQLFE